MIILVNIFEMILKLIHWTPLQFTSHHCKYTAYMFNLHPKKSLSLSHEQY